LKELRDVVRHMTLCHAGIHLWPVARFVENRSKVTASYRYREVGYHVGAAEERVLEGNAFVKNFAAPVDFCAQLPIVRSTESHEMSNSTDATQPAGGNETDAKA
jgi:hypothetical protein